MHSQVWVFSMATHFHTLAHAKRMRILVSHLSRVALYAVLSVTVGCGGGLGEPPADNLDFESEHSIRVKPGGSDKPATLTIELPDLLKPKAAQANGQIPLLSSSAKRLTYGTPVAMPSGPVDIQYSWLNNRGDVYQTYKFPISLQPSERRTITLGGVTFRPPREKVVGIDVFPTFVSETRKSTGQVPVDLSKLDVTKTLARFADTFKYQWGVSDGTEIQVTSNVVTSVDFNDYSKKAALRIVTPARFYPNCYAGPSYQEYYRIAVTTQVPTRPSTLIDPLDASGSTFVVADVGDSAGARQHRLWTAGSLNDESNAIPLTLSPAGGAIATLALGRVDVDDVDVATNTGSTTVKGTYRLYKITQKNGQDVVSTRPITQCPTSTGIDVVPGRYKLVVDYQTVETGVKQTVDIIDVPPGN
jgi:hypothetical protein